MDGKQKDKQTNGNLRDKLTSRNQKVEQTNRQTYCQNIKI